MCIFVNTLRPDITLRIWDMFLNEGSKVLFRISLALFKSHEKLLTTAKDAGDLFIKLRDLGRDVTDADLLISMAYKSYQPLVNQTTTTSSIRRQSLSYQQLPESLTGFGLAHLGPIDTNINSSAKLNDIKIDKIEIISEILEISSNNGYTSDETTEESRINSIDTILTKDDIEITVVPKLTRNISNNLEHSVRSAETLAGVALIKSKSMTQILQTDGSYKSILISDIGNKKVRKKSNISTSEGYNSFKRKDIELYRIKHRVEVLKQFQAMEDARIKWKKEQNDKNEIDELNNVDKL